MRRSTTFRTYSDRHSNLEDLAGSPIAILGYGSQGRAQALNIRDSGLDVIIGLAGKSKKIRQAREEGFRVYSTERAVKSASLVSILAPDHLQREIYDRQIGPNLTPGQTLIFACGFSVHFKLILPPDFVDVVMVAPHAPGEVMRNLFLEHKGVPCFIAIKQDKSGHAKKKALAYAKAIGCTRAGAFETNFGHEAIGDIFGEQAVVCGGLTELVKTGFEVLVDAGLSPESAYLECVHQLDYIVNIIKSHGIAGMFDRISKTAEFGSYVSGKKIITRQTKKQMQKVLDEIKDGRFAKKWTKEYQSGMKHYGKLKKQAAQHPIEKASRKIRRLSG